jgi:heme/copper-type cytochrome/quinol oxidase subunit 2
MYMRNLDSLVVGDSRFLEVDNRLVLPVGGRINFLITSSDVIHGFNLPSVGVKYDALPGILTVVPFKVFNMGTYVGQCSEICGAGHAFMPIVVEASRAAAFQQMLLEMHVQLAPANPVVTVPRFSSPTVKSFLTRFGETYDAHHESPF